MARQGSFGNVHDCSMARSARSRAADFEAELQNGDQLIISLRVRKNGARGEFGTQLLPA